VPLADGRDGFDAPGRCSASPRNAGRRRGGRKWRYRAGAPAPIALEMSGQRRSITPSRYPSSTHKQRIVLPPIRLPHPFCPTTLRPLCELWLLKRPLLLCPLMLWATTERCVVMTSVAWCAVCRPLGHAEDDVRRPTPMLSRSAMNRASSRTGSNSTAAVTRINEPSRSSKARFSQWKRLSRSDRPR
jgi:hypothetical protein